MNQTSELILVESDGAVGRYAPILRLILVEIVKNGQTWLVGPLGMN